MQGWQILLYYLLASAMAFFAYWLDKSAAREGRWRIPESRLHLLALMGGWPGAWLAQRTLRHKTRKQPFQTIFWTTGVLHCAVLAWALSPQGRSMLLAWMR